MSFLVIVILEKLRESVPRFIFANQPVFLIYSWLGWGGGGEWGWRVLQFLQKR